MQRILDNREYRARFAKAFPAVPLDELDFGHAATAIADFEATAFAAADTPWDRYVAGDDSALSEAQKRGAELFFGDALCSSCHSGPLLTDQRAHVLAVPQLGPGKGDEAPLDAGRWLETGEDLDRFAFRTPPLRNVTLTGPYMHDGAFVDLENAVRHHLDCHTSFANYDPQQLVEDLRQTVIADEEFHHQVLANLDEQVVDPLVLTDEEVEALLAFLEALTDPSSTDLEHVVPDRVPSGLPVDR